MRNAAFVMALVLGGCGGTPPEPGPIAPDPAPVATLTFELEITRLGQTFATSTVGRTIAVLEFPDLQNRTTDLSRLVSEELTTVLVRSLGSRGRVVERRHVLQVLAEENLAKAELTREQVSYVGRRLGASAIVLGSTAIVGQRLVVNARMVDVAGFDVLAADRLSVQALPELVGLTGRTQFPAISSGGTRQGRMTDDPADWSNHEIRVQVVGIESSSRGTVIPILATNLMGMQTTLSLLKRRIALVDDHGNRYPLIGGDGFQDLRDPVVRHRLMPNLPIRLSLLFGVLMPEARAVTLVLDTSYGGRIGCCRYTGAALGPLAISEPIREQDELR